MELNNGNILEIMQGAIKERAEIEFEKVIDNITDVNTKANAKREISIKITFTPDEKRQFSDVDVEVKSKLASYTKLKSSMNVYKNGNEYKAVENTSQCPGQLDIDGNVATAQIIEFRKEGM